MAMQTCNYCTDEIDTSKQSVYVKQELDEKGGIHQEIPHCSEECLEANGNGKWRQDEK